MIFDTIVSRTPVSGGWTADKKYRAECADGSRFFLRVCAPERAARLGEVFRVQRRAAGLGIPMARPVECGPCAGGFYTLEEWIDGADAREVIPNRTDAELYADGLAAGGALRKLHTIPAPEDRPDWSARYGAKIDLRIAQYRACPFQYERDAPFLRFLAENRGLLRGRPQSFQHGDFHVGNFRYAGGRLHVIDFDRFGCGDPWEDFNRITWTARAAPPMARGLVDGYFEGRIPEEFWRLLALYICCGMLGSLPWAIPFGEDEVEVMRRQAAQVLEWYDDLSAVIPSWYTEKRSGTEAARGCGEREENG